MALRISRALAIAAIMLGVMLGVVGQHRAQAATAILRGIASMAQGPVAGGAIQLYDGPTLIQSEPYRRFYNGTISVQLNEAAASALAAGVLRVDVAVDQTTTLMADLGRFNPSTQVIFINPVTTITAAYRNLKPAIAVARADGTVAEALGVSSPAATACEPVTGFSGPMVSSESVSSGGFNAYVQSAARQIAQGKTPSLHSALGVPQDFRDFFLETAGDIFSEALGGFPGVGPLAGWVLGQIYSAPNETPEERQQIEAQLSNIFSQLNQILDGITQLSTQIQDVEKTITDAIKLSDYQRGAAKAQDLIDDLCDMQKQLMYLATADPSQNNTQFADTLQVEIQSEVGKDLSHIWGALEGNKALGTLSLINEWSDLVGTGPNASIFANVSYLKSAVPNLQYYLGAILVGYNLQIEQAHWLELKGAPDLAKSIIAGSSSDFEQHDDVEMKLVANNQEIGGAGTTGLYAAVLPPFFAAAMQPNPKNPAAYSSDPTNAYNWSIDLRSGLMWMRSRSCDAGNCTFAMYDKEGGFGSGVALVQPYLSNITAVLNKSYPELLLALTAPSRAQWRTMLPNNRSLFGYHHFWTSDVYKQAPGPRLFPVWENFFVDTSWYPGEICNPGQHQYECPEFPYGEPTDDLQLVSAAALTDPYHFVYRSHEDYLPRNVFAKAAKTAPMTAARADATATPLLNGKVLIAGGNGDGGALRGTELYDPATGSFTAGPSMNAARGFATATLLPNGKVLIAGGVDSSGNKLKSTELYDPVTNTFAAADTTAAMNTARAYAAATSLPDGKVLIAGGVDQYDEILKSTELYDAYANTFAPADFSASMNDPHEYGTATLLPNGKVLITGDSTASPKSTELYDPATNTFAAGPPMNADLADATATLLPNGKVLIAGGYHFSAGQFEKGTELYDPATDTFAAGPSMNAGRGFAVATLLPNGKVLIAGGDGARALLSSTELYDPATDTFAAADSTPSMNSARELAAAVVLPNSQVLIIGGNAVATKAPLSTTELYTE